MLKPNIIVLRLVISVLKHFAGLLHNRTTRTPCDITSPCGRDIWPVPSTGMSRCVASSSRPHLVRGSEQFSSCVLSFVHRWLMMMLLIINRRYDRPILSCAATYTFVQGWQPTGRGNTKLDTPKPINIAMKTSVGIAWRIRCVCTQEALVSEDLLMLKLELRLSRIVYPRMVREERKILRFSSCTNRSL